MQEVEFCQHVRGPVPTCNRHKAQEESDQQPWQYCAYADADNDVLQSRAAGWFADLGRDVSPGPVDKS